RCWNATWPPPSATAPGSDSTPSPPCCPTPPSANPPAASGRTASGLRPYRPRPPAVPPAASGRTARCLRPPLAVISSHVPPGPRRVAESVGAMSLRYATVTGVARDDLEDGGAWLYAQTAREIHAAVPGCGVELLVPDFNAEESPLAEVFDAAPEVFAHNLETVP